MDGHTDIERHRKVRQAKKKKKKPIAGSMRIRGSGAHIYPVQPLGINSFFKELSRGLSHSGAPAQT